MSVLAKFPWLAESFEDIREDHGGRYVSAKCVVHPHKTATLRFWCGENGALVFKCWSGKCERLEVLRTVGRGWKDCFPEDVDWKAIKRETVATYVYKDEKRNILYRKLRVEPGYGGKDKTFFQERRTGPNQWCREMGDVRRVLYRLPELLAAKPTETVYLVAGEKDVDSLRDIGLLATTNVGGEREEWTDEYTESLRGRHVVVVADADATGRRHANEVCGALMGAVASLRRAELPAKDTTAFLTQLRAAGHADATALQEFMWGAVSSFPRWEVMPDETPHRCGQVA